MGMNTRVETWLLSKNGLRGKAEQQRVEETPMDYRVAAELARSRGIVIDVDLTTFSGRTQWMTYDNTTYYGNKEDNKTTEDRLATLFKYREGLVEELKQHYRTTPEYQKTLKAINSVRGMFVSVISKDDTMKLALASSDQRSNVKVKIDDRSKTIVAELGLCGCSVVFTPTVVIWEACANHSNMVLWHTCGFQPAFLAKYNRYLSSWNPCRMTVNEQFDKLGTSLAAQLYEGKSFHDLLNNCFPRLNTTKKESHKAFMFLVEQNNAKHAPHTYDTNELHQSVDYLRELWADQWNLGEEHWNIRTESRDIYQWAGKKWQQLSKPRVNAHGESLAAYITRIDEVRVQDLTNGVKTSVETVFENVDERLIVEDLERRGYSPEDKFPAPPWNGTENVRYISNPRDLIEEGKNMNHCVGMYVDDCLDGDSFMYHISTEEQETTVEIGRRRGEWRVIQHFGINNQEACKANEKALYAMLDEVPNF